MQRTINASLLVTALTFLFATYYFDWLISFGVALGSLWCTANVYLIGIIIERVMTPGDHKWGPVALAALIKFPLLYLLGYLIISREWYPVAAPLTGFLIPFGVFVLKALGRLILGIDGPDAGRRMCTVQKR